MKYYMAYGSNLNKEQMRYRCPGAKARGTALLAGYRLAFKGSKTGAYLTIVEDPEGFVPVGIWSITKEDENNLDLYEGYPRFYDKVKVPASRIKGIYGDEAREIAQNSIIYIMTDGRPEGEPTSWYLDICMNGYDDFGMDPGPLWDAYAKSIKNRKGEERWI